MNTIKKVIVVHKTHLDIGFTDLAQNVLDRYVDEFIPKAIDTAYACNRGDKKNFVWTVGSFLIKYFLDHSPDSTRLIQAIQDGYITWHGLGVTTHTELMNPALIRYDLDIARQLDHRFSRHTISAKMTDVPCHTHTLVPYLAEYGIRYFHIGINPSSKPVNIPPICRQRYGDSEIILNYASTYGAADIFGEYALEFAHTGDNMGPPAPEQVLSEMKRLQDKYPGAEITSGTMDDFAQHLLANTEKMPLITAELGDTWIHGAAADPWKMGAFNQLLRIRDRWIAEDPQAVSSPEYDRFMLNLLLTCEHTCGTDSKRWLDDYENWAKDQFHKVRPAPNFTKMEASWREQRAYLLEAISALPAQYQPAAKEETEALLPGIVPEYSGESVTGTITINGYQVELCSNGSIKLLSSPEGAFGNNTILGDLIYCTYSAETVTRCYHEYNHNIEETREWSEPDFAKPGLDQVPGLQDHAYHYHLDYAAKELDTLTLFLSTASEACKTYGAPRTALVTYKFSSSIKVTLQWFDKDASRLPEAVFFGFHTDTQNSSPLTITKLGLPVNPYNVCEGGNRKLHAVSLVKYGCIQIENLHSPLLSPGGYHLYDTDDTYGDIADGIYYLLFNNRWNTNFPLWYDDNASFTYVLSQAKDM